MKLLCDEQFKEMVMRMLTELEREMDEHRNSTKDKYQRSHRSEGCSNY